MLDLYCILGFRIIIKTGVVKMSKEQDSKNLVVLMWVGTIFLGFIPSLVFYILKKDDELIVEQAKEALNWSIVATIGYVVGMALTFILIGFFILVIVGISNFVFCILGAIAASKGDHYKVPFIFRLIK